MQPVRIRPFREMQECFLWIGASKIKCQILDSYYQQESHFETGRREGWRLLILIDIDYGVVKTREVYLDRVELIN